MSSTSRREFSAQQHPLQEQHPVVQQYPVHSIVSPQTTTFSTKRKSSPPIRRSRHHLRRTLEHPQPQTTGIRRKPVHNPHSDIRHKTGQQQNDTNEEHCVSQSGKQRVSIARHRTSFALPRDSEIKARSLNETERPNVTAKEEDMCELNRIQWYVFNILFNTKI